ncbi:Transposase and inactivated derivatives [Pseudomonas putida]|nr:Transposase and inactivated derivatives [Pseudomonas putida]
MSNPRYPEEFKIEAVRQVTERGLPVAEVASRLGMSTHSLYAWVKRYSKPEKQRVQEDDQQAELRRLRAELKRVTEERDILKRPPRTLPRSAAEVRPHQSAIRRLFRSPPLPDPESTCQRLLRLAG